MEKQHNATLQNQFRESLIRQVAGESDIPHQHLREEHHNQQRTERIGRMIQSETQTDPVVDITNDEPEFMDAIDFEDVGVQATTDNKDQGSQATTESKNKKIQAWAVVANKDQGTQAGAVAADYEAEVQRRQAAQEAEIIRQQEAHAAQMERMRQEVRDRLVAEQLQHKDDIARAKQEIDNLASRNLAFELEAQEQKDYNRKIKQDRQINS